jgi:hypothetical protein
MAVGVVAVESYEKSVTGSPEQVIMKTDDLSAGTITVEVRVSEAPGGGTDLIYREEKTVANLPDTWMVLKNDGAYENVTVTVKGASTEPEIGDETTTGKEIFPPKHIALRTGGDRDYVCGLSERLSTAVNPAYQSTDCNYALPGTTTVENADQLDANETKLEIYQSAAAQADAADNYHTMLDNRLQDTESVALIKGKSAYVRALNDAGSQSVAEAQATRNITEYYSVMEYNLLQRWNAQVNQAEYLQNLINSTQGVGEYYLNGSHDKPVNQNKRAEAYVTDYGTKTYTLQNGSTIDVRTVTVTGELFDTDMGSQGTSSVTFGPTTGRTEVNPGGFGKRDKRFNLTGIGVKPLGQNYDYKEIQTSEDHATHLLHTRPPYTFPSS